MFVVEKCSNDDTFDKLVFKRHNRATVYIKLCYQLTHLQNLQFVVSRYFVKYNLSNRNDFQIFEFQKLQSWEH